MKESIFFYTFHKTSSSFFNHSVLPHIKNYQHVDYETKVYEGLNPKFDFQLFDHIYGPFRISSTGLKNFKSPMYNLASTVLRKEFIKNKYCVFFIRDPRDILVSAYYSFKFSHRFSNFSKMQERQKKQLEILNNSTIDEWVLFKSKEWKGFFKTFDSLFDENQGKNLLKYEEMIDNWPSFSFKIQEILNLDEELLNKIFTETRPNLTEQINEHKRSGRTEGFRLKLSNSTIQILNESFADILMKYGYQF